MPAAVPAVDVLKALADQTRLRIASLVAEAGDLCACEIEVLLGVNQSNLSRHLTRLESAGVLESEKRGRWVHYRLPGAGTAAGAAGDQAATARTADMTGAILRCARAASAQLIADLTRLAEYQASGR